MSAPVDLAVVVSTGKAPFLLEGSVRRLHGFLRAKAPYSWRIVIASGPDGDPALETARRLSYDLEGVDMVHLHEPPRGVALQRATATAGVEARAVIDIEGDLSTDLDALAGTLQARVPGECADRGRRRRVGRALTLVSPRRTMLAS